MHEMEEPQRVDVEHETEKIARRMARDAGNPEELWELFLLDAYREFYQITRHE